MRKMLSILIFILGCNQLWAASFKTNKYEFSINAYLDIESTWMSQMAMSMGSSEGPGVMKMDQQFTLDQNHLNLIFSAIRKKTRVYLNYESRHTFSTFDGDTGILGRDGNGSDNNVGSFRVAEAYGEYNFTQYFKVRGGSFLAPFGIFNELRYATPLFATIVLPFIYEMPGNYRAPPLIPSNANIMFHGNIGTKRVDLSYNAYIGASKRNNNDSPRSVDSGTGLENTKNKTFGGKLHASFREGKYSIGVSFNYTEFPDILNNVTNTKNHSSMLKGIELELYLPYNFHLQAEHVSQSNPEGKSDTLGKTKWGYYSRLMYEKYKLTPFIMYDVFKDPNETVYRFKNNRFGIGAGYKISKNFYIKSEWHWHWFSSQPFGTGIQVNTSGPKETRMFRSSMIFFF
ncbi:MAG: hypothetical protein HN576_05115 [Bacteriovoracaceae bacterium]|jgi:hypothetical protein|nr:hypothetical protein [Bacteriovoracaceae bacterium]